MRKLVPFLIACLAYLPLHAVRFLESNTWMDVGKWSYDCDLQMMFPYDKCLKIGSFCAFAPGVKMIHRGDHRTDWISTFPFMGFPSGWSNATQLQGHPTGKGPIIIGNDVWIGTGVTILSGVTIGDGAVIGANAVVSKDVPPYAIAVGNPARVVKYRFSSDVIETLLRISWWNWPDDEINDVVRLLCSDEIESFIQYCEENNKIP